MAPLSLFPSGDREQTVRFRRYLIAAGTSLMVVGLLGICVLAGVLAPRPFAIAAGIVMLSITAFYAVFRSGLNRRAHDASLTVPMMVAAIFVVTYALFHLGAVRTVFLLLYPMIMFFGVLRLGTRALLLVAAVIMFAYALVIRSLAQREARVDPITIELLRGLVLATVLVWFAFMGGYVHDLRTRLRESGFDPLTRINNRARVLDALAYAKIRYDRRADPLCVCLLDVDQLKDINDTLGHRAGDLALQAVAGIARDELRAIDAAGRYGGDEFLLVLSGTERDGARDCAERIRGRIARSDCIANTHRQVTVSGGVAQYRQGESLEDTLQRADAALYRAKSAGGNRVERD
jgi:diguanylate cyclase (GGDEF)-like protein